MKSRWLKWNIHEKFLHLYGFSFNGTKLTHGIFIQITVLVMQILLLFHSSMFVITHGAIDSSSAQAFFTSINSVMSFIKMYSVIANQREIGNLKIQIESVSDKITYKNRQIYTKEYRKYSHIVNFVVFSTLILCMLVYVVGPLMEVIVAFITGIPAPKYFLNATWFPFDPYEYYVPVRLYNLIIVNACSNCVLSAEGSVMLIFGQLSVLFKSLADDIVEVVDEHDEKKTKLTETRLIAKVKLHVELIEITKNMAEMYEFAFLAHTLCFAGSTCFILLKALVVDTGGDVYASMATVLNMFMYFYYICYFGEKTVEGVS